MINVEKVISQRSLRPSLSGYCAVMIQCNQYENLEILYYPKAPDTSILCSTGKMTAVSKRAIKEVLQEIAPYLLPEERYSLPVCLVQCYSKAKTRPFLFRFAVQDPYDSHNHGIITSSRIYCPIHDIFLHKKSVSRHLKSHKMEEGENVFIKYGRNALSVDNFDKRAFLKLNEDVVANLLVFKTPALFNSLSLNEQIAYQMFNNFKSLSPILHPFPNTNEIKQKYGESAELKMRTHLELLTNLQRRLQYEALSAFVDSTQQTVTGEVKFKLYKGNIIDAGVTSPYSLYDPEIATFDEDEVYDQNDSAGFINLFGLPIKVRAQKGLIK